MVSVYNSIKFDNLIKLIPNNRNSGCWVYSENFYSLPNIGYKIHVSCSNDNIIEIGNKVIPFLVSTKTSFKMIASLSDLSLLNYGRYGYSQIGKAFTIYPKDYNDFIDKIYKLYLITKSYKSPSVPSDFRFLNSNTIFYRYGSLSKNVIEDRRVSFLPQECKNILPHHNIKRINELHPNLCPVKILYSSGKSNIVKVFDSSLNKYCVLKIGKFLGNLEHDNVDSFDRVAWEAYVLKDLHREKSIVKIIDTFILDNDFCILEEYIDGNSIDYIIKNGRDNYIKNLSKILLQLYDAVFNIHKLGYLLFDISAGNILIDESENVRIIDVEYFFNEKNKYYKFDRYCKGSVGFIYPAKEFALEKKDIYALLKLIYFLYNPDKYLNLIENISKLNINDIDEKELNFFEEKEEIEMIKFFKINIFELLNKDKKEILIFIKKFIEVDR